MNDKIVNIEVEQKRTSRTDDGVGLFTAEKGVSIYAAANSSCASPRRLS